MTKCQQETRQSLKDPARRDLIAGAAGAVADVSGAVRGRGDVPPGDDPGEAAAVGHPGKAAGAVFRAGDHSVHAHRL